ncbi:malto-oligosyltrehalose synthase [Pseudoroseomonas rhizosphaerae]|uniref:Malto-oligosyltrehalose synthase n=1 Tax=Teichococcus rhizosphaerae TaxID=1335062 RepID=A0A2C7A8Q8_9PROT|nr:malto-oligosyltrehalose synthase [Pseudoroseomonas rhizosphaerae]PHK96508.1 malto-oligosyltrehalose synthase [Pseudoroseomonas rhizosphaerae]
MSHAQPHPAANATPAATRPRATYRIQFHAEFTLDDAVAIVPYLSRLGVSHLYASPLLPAAPGSTHGYDITAHDAVNPALGGEPALRRLVAALRAEGMGLLLDIVPNHMGVDGPHNAWWQDVLAKGQESDYARFFDIDWNSDDPSLKGRMLAPFLGRPYGEALAEGELTLVKDGPTGLSVAYFDNRFPIAPRDAEAILDDPEGLAGHDPKSLTGAARLHALLERQNYRLAWWRTATDEINWRRFFDVTGLAGLRAEEPAVFDATHALILRLYAEGLIDGVRIDHVDGLADPGGYCRKLRRRMEAIAHRRPAEAPAGPPYILIEKILAPGEPLETRWKTDGTTGYDFMDQVSAVLHDPAGEAPLSALWRETSGSEADFHAEEIQARKQILRDNLAAELDGCARAFHHLARGHLRSRDFSFNAIRRVLAQLLVHFPVYRVYVRNGAPTAQDVAVLRQAADAARASLRTTDHVVLSHLLYWLAEEPVRERSAGEARRALLVARTRFQQLSSPTAAKSVEDTAFYRYGRLLSRNEVGSNPGQFALPPEGFHALMAARATDWPGALLATATHDHKRGEDVRMRLAVLSEIPDEWAAALRGFLAESRELVQALPEGPAPSPGDAVMLLQMVVASWPLGLPVTDRAGVDAWVERLSGWLQKAMREAKRRSGWAMPDEAYEAATAGFLRGVLDVSARPALATGLQGLAARIALPGALKSLAQTTLRMTCPGVPDLYQGAEFWDESLVDPDNRRPVDYAARRAALERGAEPLGLLADWSSGAVKQALIHRLLLARAEAPSLFTGGHYVPLRLEGRQADAMLAFLRQEAGEALLVAVPRLAVPLLGHAETLSVPDTAWSDTRLVLPAELSARSWHCLLTGATLPAGGTLPLAGNPLPLRVLRATG